MELNFATRSWQRVPSLARRWIRLGAIVLVGVYAFYLLAGNIFINTPIGEWTANRKPEKFQIQWSRGLTLWPGRVHVWDVRLKGHAGRATWSVEAARASGRIAILPLLRKTVRVPEVVAYEVTGAVDIGGPHKPPLPARAGGWVLQFDRIHSDSIRHGRLGDLVLDGVGRANVGFFKQLRGGALELMPSQAHFENAQLRFGKDALLRDGRIDADFAIARHTRDQARGIAKLLLTDATLKLDGKAPTLGVSIDPQGRIALSNVAGDGRAQIDLGFARGSLTPGSRLRWHTPVRGRDGTGKAFSDALDVALDVDRDMHLIARAPAQAEGRLSLDADVTVRGTQVPLKDARSLLPRSSGHVVGRWHFASLRWLGSFFDAPWLSLDGAGVVDADVRVIDGRIAGGSRVGVPDVQAVAHVMGNRIAGRARADGRLDTGPDDEVLPRLELVMERFDIAADDAAARPFVQGQNLRLLLESVSGVERQALRQPGAMKQVGQAMRAHLTFADAKVPDLRAYNRYLPNDHLRFDGGSGTLSGDLTLDGAGAIGQGTLGIDARAARMHLAGIALRTDVDIDTKLRRADLKRHTFNIDGTRMALANVSFTEPGGESRGGWWTRIDLQRARMDWDRPVSIDGRARIAMKDVGFLLALFSRQKDYPKWMFKLVDSGPAQANGNVRLAGQTLLLDNVDASNARYDVKARLRLHGKQRAGSLYAKWGVLSCAVAVDNGQRDFHLIRAREWYDAQPAMLP
ncbi:hypothetical protein [Lysobacter auxotrophicus]|uniref:AsmA family protein n=1 Tax=Lysobacter auxotrophicus TaxID=2992573 RepID=A0ABM8DCB4_9GAMM|nr:hypothetical protein [Lysobacter auxotrophicus]BDU16230.1 hypothetical protein LA521A_14310 [Lysobacter auxotrophicus]